ncbi:MAG TPA: hypothetical protein PKH79_13265 [Prolixibacteraceae bacterium]|nr:hypothetical protein [Prolixibacteraceae bacterium]
MKNYVLKCDKWYSASQSVYANEQKVGAFYYGMFGTEYKILLGENEYLVRKKNFFSDDLSIFVEDQLLAEVRNSAFKNRSLITTREGKEYTLRSNTWSSRFTLTGVEGVLGECVQKMNYSSLSFDERTDDSLIAAIIAEMHITYESSILIACLVPIFVAIIA